MSQPTYDKRHARGVTAATALAKHRFATLAGGYAGPSDDVAGVTEADVAAGRLVSLITGFSALVEAAGVIAAGDRVGPAGDGTGRAVAGGAAGVALSSATAAGQLVEVEVRLGSGLSGAQVQAVQASQPGRTQEVALRHALRRPIIRSGRFAGSGTRQRIRIGFRPDVVIVKSSAAQPGLWRTATSWRGNSQKLANSSAHNSNAIVELTDDGFIVNTDSAANGSGASINYVAIADNGSGRVVTAAWQGTGVSGLQPVDLPEEPVFVMIKRDNTFPCWSRASGQARSYSLGADASSDDMILSLYPLTLSAQPDVNAVVPGAPGSGGEAYEMLALLPCDTWHVQQYTGTGAALTLATPFSDEDQIAFGLIKSHNDVSPACSHVFFGGQAANISSRADNNGEVSTAITSRAGATVVLNTLADVNTASDTYTMLVIKEAPEAGLPAREQRPTRIGRPALRCESGGGILTQVGQAQGFDVASPAAWTMEFVGTVNAASTTSVLMALAAASSVMAAAIYASSNFNHLYSQRYDSTAKASELGLRPAPNAPVHIVLRSNGDGANSVLTMSINGVHKRFYRPVAVTMPIHTKLAFLCNRAASDALANSAVGCSFALGRFYARQLSDAEVVDRYKFVFGIGGSDVVDYVEEWDAANVSGSTLRATRSSANDAVIAACTAITI